MERIQFELHVLFVRLVACDERALSGRSDAFLPPPAAAAAAPAPATPPASHFVEIFIFFNDNKYFFKLIHGHFDFTTFSVTGMTDDNNSAFNRVS
ncbi:hypothetical protein BLOT_003471 [Blomia tropicalis]|nr:hypothetical protein BLOT_003471 [Blomia tropicalis]